MQGLDWYKARLKQDSDGDIADEFLEESAMRPQRAGKHHRTVLQVLCNITSFCLHEHARTQHVSTRHDATSKQYQH